MASRTSFPLTTFTDSSGEPVANGYALLSLPDDGGSPDGLICRGLVCRVELDVYGSMQTIPYVWPSSSLLNPNWTDGLPYLLSTYTAEGQAVSQFSVTVTVINSRVTVPGTTQTWNPTTGNAAYPFAGGPHGAYGTPPIVIACSPGDIITVSATGACSGGPPTSSPDGVPYTGVVYPVDPSHGRFPSSNVPGATVDGPLWFSLLGAFADSSGTLVVPPFLVGSSATLTAPSGTAQLQMGINDNELADNSGSFTAVYEIGR